MANCDYSRLRVEFAPGNYSLAVWASNFPVPTGGTWNGVYWQARLYVPGEWQAAPCSCSLYYYPVQLVVVLLWQPRCRSCDSVSAVTAG